ncbi:MAG: c-type cytochrome [Aeoliella sp.]
MARIALAEGDHPSVSAAVLSSISRNSAAQVLSTYESLSMGEDRGDIFPRLISLTIRIGSDNDVRTAFQIGLARSAEGGAGRRFTNLTLLLDACQDRNEVVGLLDAPSIQRVRQTYQLAVECLSSFDTQEEDLRAALRLLSLPASKAMKSLLELDDLAITQIQQKIGEMLSIQRPPTIQREALSSLSRMAHIDSAALLIRKWKELGPTMRSEILDTLLSREAWTLWLVRSLEEGEIGTGDLNAIRRQQLIAHRNADIRASAEKLFHAPTSSERSTLIEKYRLEVSKKNTDFDRGRDLFRKSCSTCHRLEGHGRALGPDLAALTNNDPEWLLTTVLEPNREVDSRFQAWTVVDINGRVMTGLLSEETASSIRLTDAGGKDHVILRRDLDELESSNRSFMPEGLQRDLSPADMAHVIAYLSRFEAPYKKFSGNQPRAAEQNPEEEYRLTAAIAEIRGGEIRFESPFKNIGYWHAEGDYATWTIDAPEPGRYDIYLDFACPDDSAGNRFRIDGISSTICGEVTATGGWDRYQQVKVGTTEIAPGRRRITVRPDGPLLKPALFDLREMRLVAAGRPTRFGSSKTVEELLPRFAEQIAPFLLDESQPVERRQAVIDLRPGMGPSIVSLLSSDMNDDSDEEYRRIPWIWRVAIACGKRNDGGELRDLLDECLPRDAEILHDWQAVAIGGGIINGISQKGLWPDERLPDVLTGVPDGLARWSRTLDLAAELADDESVRLGTRYDALRIIALAGWERRGAHLLRYLREEVPDELQMGAVSGLVDIRSDKATEYLITHFPKLSAQNQKLALQGLMRTESRSVALLEAIGEGRVAKDTVDKHPLVNHSSDRVKEMARSVFGN